MNYSEKLKDPRWQKKRLEIFERDSFCCQKCLSEDKTLHVHHKKYQHGKEPWEYDDKWLVTLCEDCHTFETENFNNLFKDLTDILRENLTSKGLASLIQAFGNTKFSYSPDLYADVADQVFKSHYLEEIIEKMGRGWTYFEES